MTVLASPPRQFTVPIGDMALCPVRQFGDDRPEEQQTLVDECSLLPALLLGSSPFGPGEIDEVELRDPDLSIDRKRGGENWGVGAGFAGEGRRPGTGLDDLGGSFVRSITAILRK